MNKFSITICTFFFFTMSSNIVAQLNISTLLEKSNSKTVAFNALQFRDLNNPKTTLHDLTYEKESKINSPEKFYQLKNHALLNGNALQKTNSMMSTNRRLKYSSLWAFAALNYLYADLVGLMDLNLLSQYQTGTVNGIEITPGFLTAAAAYMQIPLANVFLPHLIKNERALRWVQIISGSIATIAQGATLFVGKPAPYYVLFSAIEMVATSYITIDAIKWKTNKTKKKNPIDF